MKKTRRLPNLIIVSFSAHKHVRAVVNYLFVSTHLKRFCFLFLGSFLYCSTAKLKTPPQDTFFTHLTVQSMGPNHPWPLVIENWFLFLKLESSPGIWTRDLWLRSPSLYQLYHGLGIPAHVNYVFVFAHLTTRAHVNYVIVRTSNNICKY